MEIVDDAVTAPRAASRQRRGQRLVDWVLDPSPPWYRSVILYLFIVALAWFAAGYASRPTMPLAGNLTYFGGATVVRDGDVLRVQHEYDSLRRMESWSVQLQFQLRHTEMCTGLKATELQCLPGRGPQGPAPELTAEELSRLWPQVVKSEELEFPEVPAGELARLQLALAGPGLESVIWHSDGVVRFALRQTALVVFAGLTLLALLRRVRRVRILRRLSQTEHLRCLVCRYDLTAIKPAADPVCPECGARYADEVRRLQSLVGGRRAMRRGDECPRAASMSRCTELPRAGD